MSTSGSCGWSVTATWPREIPWGFPCPSVSRIAVRRFLQFFRGAERTSPEDLLHAARVLLWVRWFGLTAAFPGNPLPRRLRVPEPRSQHLLLPGVPGGQRVCPVAHTPQGDGQAVVAVRTERPGPGGDLVQRLPFRRFQQPLLRAVLLRGGGVRLRVHLSPAGPALDHPGGGHLLGAELCGGAGAGPGWQGGAAPLLPAGGAVTPSPPQ